MPNHRNQHLTGSRHTGVTTQGYEFLLLRRDQLLWTATHSEGETAREAREALKDVVSEIRRRRV